jgi:hypothetical protein
MPYLPFNSTPRLRDQARVRHALLSYGFRASNPPVTLRTHPSSCISEHSANCASGLAVLVSADLSVTIEWCQLPALQCQSRDFRKAPFVTRSDEITSCHRRRRDDEVMRAYGGSLECELRCQPGVDASRYQIK